MDNSAIDNSISDSGINTSSVTVNNTIKNVSTDTISENTISVSGYMGGTGGWQSSFDVIIGPSLYFYPNVYSYKELPDFNNTSYTQIGNCRQGSYIYSSPFSFSKKIDTLKPNTYYYIQFSFNKYYRNSNDNTTEEKIFIKKISFNSCPIEDSSLVLPTIISGDKICLLDGVGKNELFVNSDFFGSPPEYNDIIFQDVFNIDLAYSVYVDSNKDIASNCYGNRLCKAYSISDTNTGLFDAGIFKMIKPINCSDYSKIKITYVLTHNYTAALNVRAYMYVGQQTNVLQPVAKESYNWEQWTLIGEMSTNGQHALFTCTYDISALEDAQDLFIGVYHGAETAAYTAQCYITEIELQ